MLKSYLIFVYLSIGFSGLAQQYYQLDSIVHSIDGIQFIASQKYHKESQKGELVKYQRQSMNDTVQIKEGAQVAYDAKGNELLSVFSVWNSALNTWDDEEKTEQEFNADNKLIRVRSQQKRENQWITILETSRLYVQDSIIEMEYAQKDAKFQPTHKNIAVINASDKIKTYEIFLWNAKTQNWQPLTRTENFYQNDTTLVGTETVEWKGNQWQKQEKVVYKLDKQNLSTANYILYKGQNNHWIPFSKFEEEFLPEQHKKISNTYKWENIPNKWIVQTQVETYFNTDGKKQDVLFSELDTSTHQLKLQLEQLHLYDKAGRLTLFQDFFHSNGKRTGTQNTVKFDNDGNLIQENRYEFDPINNTWIENMTIEFVYDKNILLDNTLEAHGKSDLFDLNPYSYITNTSAAKQVKIYLYDNGKKVLSEEFSLFYSFAK